MRHLIHHIRSTLLRFKTREDGAVIVEFALTLPIMLITFALIAEGGRLFWAYQDVITGVRDTSRYISRIAPSDMCSPSPSAAIGDYQGLATTQLANLSTPGMTVAIDSLALECVGTAGEYRVSPTPIAVLSASLTIENLPFAPLFQLIGATSLTQIETTVIDRSRVFGP